MPRQLRPSLERLEDRTCPAPVPSTTVTAASTPLIGSQTALAVTFDNTSAVPTDIGYGPYVDLYLRATGADGDDGATFVSATYLGFPVRSTVVTLTAAGVPHPFATTATGAPRLITPPPGFRAGDQLVVLELPFGSFTPDQPRVDLNVNVAISNLADLGTALPVRTQGGFRFGADPLDNPTVDPPLLGAPATGTITPTLFTLRKEYIGPENETATGPNFVRQYRVVADLAAGQTLTNLDLTDRLPNTLQYVSVDSVTGNGTLLVTPVATPSTTVPGGTLTRRLDSVTGTLSGNDAEMLFSFYAPLMPAPPAAGEVLDPNTGQPRSVTNDARASGSWDPLDPRDPPQTVVSDATPVDHTLTLRSLATQKSATLVIDTGASGYTPGDTVEYTLDVQVSDYFAFDNLVLTDILGDGLLVDPGFTPTLTVREHGVTTNATFTAPNFTVTPGTPDDTLTFRLSDQLIALGQDGILLGGNIPPGGTGPGNRPQSAPQLFTPGTTAQIRFRAIIQDTYEQTQSSGSTTVTSTDSLPNDVTISGNVLDREDLTAQPLVPPVTDASEESVRIVGPTTSKAVYAVNGNTAIGNPVAVAPGDAVTYRLTVTLPTMSFTNFALTDFLPLPLFVATEITTVSLTTPSAIPPAAGSITLGPADTFLPRYTTLGGTNPPPLSVDATQNNFRLDFGSINDPLNQPVTLDLLFTVTATNAPKADLLLLTNQVVTTETNRDNVSTPGVDLAEVITSEPNIPRNNIRKGVVATDNPNGIFSPSAVGPVPFSPPGSAGPRFTGTITSAGLATFPIDSNLRGVDAGDRVTFAITVANVGSGPNGAFDVRLRDTIPVGFRIPTAGLNLTVTDGTGATMPFTNLGTGATAGLFGTGIELTDPGPTITPPGSLDPGSDTLGNSINTGRNIAVLTYDLEVIATITANSTLTNTVTLFNYASTEGGPNFVPVPLTDTAQVVTTSPTIAKRLVSTEIVNANNGNSQAVIGELATYEATLTVPEGLTPGVVIRDTLDSGLAFVRLNSVSVSPGVVFLPGIPSVTNAGQTVTFSLGNIRNNNRDNTQSETITLRYTAVVLNLSSNQSGTQLRNSARLTFTGGTPVVVSAQAITVIEPTIDVTKNARINGGGTIGQAGNTVEYTIVLTNPGNVDAFDLTLQDPLPRTATGQTLISGPLLASVDDSAGIVTSALFEIVGTPSTGFTLRTRPGVSFDFPVDPTRTISLRVTGTLPIIVQPGQLIRNTATVRWTSLNGNPGVRSIFNPNSTERTGTGVGPNDYLDSDNADIRIAGSASKSLIATSNSFTPDSRVAIGEIVRYRLQYRFPQGTATDFDFLDQLPAGMQYLADGSARVAFVSNGPGFTVDNTLFPVGSDAFITGNQNTPITPTFPMPAGQITVAPGSGGDVAFAFGNVVNNDNDADSELIVVDFNALVLNEAANQAGTSLTNTFQARSNAIPIGQPSPGITVQVVEPQLSIDKQVNPTTGDAGDRFDFIVTLTNASGTTISAAHDLQVLDQLPPEYTLVPATVRAAVSGSVTTPIVATAGNLVDVTVPLLLPGASVTLTYSAILNPSVFPNQVVENTARMTYTSLPGPSGQIPNPTGSTTPGASGANNGERNGAGGINDYFGSDRAFVRVPDLLMNKAVTATNFPETGSSQHDPTITDLAIGEEVTFVVGFFLPEITTTAVLIDDLPIAPGLLEAVSSRVLFIGGNILGSNLAVGDSGVLTDRNADGLDDRITFNFGTLTNQPDNQVTLDDLIFVEVVARVPDVPANQDGVQLVNTATLTFQVGELTDTATVEIVEPQMDITKNITSTNPVAAGGTVDYQLRIRHTADSTMDAVNVVITDPLPAGNNLTLVSGSVVVSPATGATITEPGTGGFQVTIPSIPLGGEVVINYQVTVGLTVQPGDQLPNTATLGYNGTPPDAAVRPQTDDASQIVVVGGAAVSGFVFHEQRPGPDLAIPGTTITLVGVNSASQPVLRTTTTDVTGFYRFTDLLPGTYTVIETQPAGFISSRQQPGSPFGQPSPTENQLNVVIPPGVLAVGTNFNFWEVQPSRVGGLVYDDVLNNGVFDPGLDPGIPGTTITLSGTDWNGLPLTRSVQTGLDGAYRFDNLLPGDYQIQETQPIGWLDNLDNIGSLGGTNPVSDLFILPPLGQNLDGTDYNFGELRPSSLSGFTYVDLNNNGFKDPREPGIPGVLIRLTGVDDRGNTINRTFRTGGSGAFVFAELRPGTYRLLQTQPPGFVDGKDRAGNLGGIVGNDIISSILVGPNEVGTDYLFGELFVSKQRFLDSTWQSLV